MMAQPLRFWLLSEHCIDPRRSSSQLHVWQVIEGLLRAGHEVAHGYFNPAPAQLPQPLAQLALRYPKFRHAGQVGAGPVAPFDVLYLTNLWWEGSLKTALQVLAGLRRDCAWRYATVFDPMDCLFKSVGPFLDAAARPRLLELETRLHREVDHSVLVSAQECRDAAAAFGIAPQRCSVVAQAYMSYAPGWTRGHAQRRHICFVGSMSPANIEAVGELLNLLTMLPPAMAPEEIHILGSGTDKLEIKGPPALLSRVRRIGYVENLDAAVSHYRVQALPLRNGAGIKGKLLQSLACGTPVLTTAKGVEGMEDVGAGVRLAAEGEDFAHKLVELYRDAAAWETQRQAGLRWLEQRYSFAQLQAQLEQLTRKLRAALAA